MIRKRRVTVSKADDGKKPAKLFRLTDIDPAFVSIVTAGANRQRQFQVVKADDSTEDEPGDQDDSSANSDDATPPLEGDDQQKTGTDPGDGEDDTSDDGDNDDTEASKVDMLAWLEEAGDTVGELYAVAAITMVDVASQEDDQPPQTGATAIVDKAQGAPSVDSLISKAKEEVQKKLDIEKAARQVAEKQVSTLTKQMQKFKADLRKANARLSKLRSGMGGSTALQVGDILAGTSKKDGADPNPSDGKWASGGDLAELAE